MTLRRRLMLAFAFLLLMAIAALSVPLAISVDRRARADYTIDLNAAAETVARAAPDVLDDPAALEALALTEARVGRIIVTDADGSLLADTTHLRRLGRDYRFRPEIVTALEGHPTRLVRDYPSGGRQYLVAVPIMQQGRVIGAVRVQRLAADVDALVRDRVLSLVGVSLAVLLVGLAVSVALARMLTRPLRRLADVAGSIGRGDFSQTAPETGQREVAEVGAALNSMRDQIQQTLDAQTDFVANASHQLRTPLTGLRLRLEAMEAAGDERAPAMLAEVDRLSGLVEDLLTLVRAGTAPPEPQVADLAAVLEEAVVRWSVPAEEGGQLLYVGDVVPEAWVAAGADDVAMILDNLIENALKYTPRGSSVEVSIADDGDGLALLVSDDGPGLAPADEQRAFERFYRGANGAGVGGTGLGLAIVRQVAERWDGSATVSVDGGTTVRVTLPRAATPQPVAASGAATSA